MKKILVLYYTQSGQLRAILDSIAKPFIDAGDSVTFERIVPSQQFPFPWSGFTFFNAFPETFSQTPLALQPTSSQAYDNFDLVILGYQPWFLTPSRPVSAWLQSDAARAIIGEKKIMTVLGCRNMWLGAQEKMKRHLRQLNGNLVGHVALVDRSGNLTSLITILRWMFSGKKDPFWFFPSAGVSDSDVQNAVVFGKMAKNAVDSGQFQHLQSEMNAAGAIEIKPNLVLMEKRGQKAFSVWSKFIARGGAVDSTGRKVRVYIFMYLLPTAIFILSPLLWIVSKVMLIAMHKKLNKEVAYHMQNGLR